MGQHERAEERRIAKETEKKRQTRREGEKRREEKKKGNLVRNVGAAKHKVPFRHSHCLAHCHAVRQIFAKRAQSCLGIVLGVVGVDPRA